MVAECEARRQENPSQSVDDQLIVSSGINYVDVAK